MADVFYGGALKSGGGGGSTIVTGATFAKGTNIASANDITLPGNGFFYDVTGVTQVNRIKPDAAMIANGFGIIALRFTGACPVHHNQTAGSGFLPIQLRNGWGPFTMSAGKWHLFAYDGSAFVHADATLLANGGLFYGQNSSAYLRSESGIFLGSADGIAYTGRLDGSGRMQQSGGWGQSALTVVSDADKVISQTEHGVRFSGNFTAPRSATLPLLGNCNADQEIIVEGPPNASSFNVTIPMNATDVSGGATIEGVTPSKTINTDYGKMKFIKASSTLWVVYAL